MAMIATTTIDEKEQKALGAEYCGKLQECAIKAFEKFTEIHPLFTSITFYAPTEENAEEHGTTD